MDYQPYKYHKLEEDSTRVLLLHAGTDRASLEGTLETVSLGSFKGAAEGDYEAISYAWESPRLNRSISTSQGFIRIPRSLYEALLCLRRKDSTRRLWADAICISQTDNEERAAQVAFMPEIFGFASKVLVWLGPSKPSCALAFATLAYEDYLARDFHEEDPLPLLDRALQDSPRCFCCGESFPARKNLGLQGLLAAKALLSRSWFKRVWTLQEVAGSPSRVTLHSGTHTASLQALKDAFMRLRHAYASFGQRYDTDEEMDRYSELLQVSEEYSSASKGPIYVEDRVDMLMRLAKRDCSDPRDRLFALRGILRIQAVSALLPDYNISSAEAYRRFVAHIFETASARSLQGEFDPHIHASSLLALCNTGKLNHQKEIDWPSWVPDFHTLTGRSIKKFQLYDDSLYMQLFRLETWPFSRSSHRFKATVSQQDIRHLCVRGRIFGTIQHVLPNSSCPRKTNSYASPISRMNKSLVESLLQWYISVCDFIRSHLDLADIHEDRHDAYIRLVLACGHESVEDFLPGDRTEHLSLLRDSLDQVDPDKRTADPKSVCHRLSPILSRTYVQYGDPDRQLCSITSPGLSPLVSWVSPGAVKGDLICIFSGSPFPFIVRDAGASVHHLIGDAWTIGIEEWQALGMSIEEHKKYETAHIGVNTRYKGMSRWWEGPELDPLDLDRGDEAVLEDWERRHLGNIVLC